MNINKREQQLIIAVIAAVVLWAGNTLVVVPLTKHWKERATRMSDLRKSLTQGTLLLEREQSIRARWESMRTNTLPSETSLAESQVVKAFDRWSQDSRISITSISPQWKHDADEYMTLQCRVEAAGTLNTLSRFLYDVEKDPMALKLESVELGVRDKNGQIITMGLQISALVLNPSTQ